MSEAYTADPSLRLFTTEQTGEILTLTPRALEERRRRGDGPPYVRVGRTCVRYRAFDLERWIDERTFTSTAEEAAKSVGAGGSSAQVEECIAAGGRTNTFADQ